MGVRRKKDDEAEKDITRQNEPVLRFRIQPPESSPPSMKLAAIP
jgi:hypothetical protein